MFASCVILVKITMPRRSGLIVTSLIGQKMKETEIIHLPDGRILIILKSKE